MAEGKRAIIVMGSDSDLPVMRESSRALDEFGVEHEVVISSAHRLPGKTSELASGAEREGVEVIIAGAGGAAHLPGVMAAYTVLPVIGVPIRTSLAGGLDSLYSIVQMPRGIPVATVAVNGAYNAGLLAVHIISLKDESLREELKSYRRKMAEGVEEKNRLLQSMGIEGYMREKELK